METIKTMEIRAETLTPLWTGGIDRKTDQIYESGLIGSLRWWYESVLRGLGKWVCESEQKCKDEKRCAACELFGTTGWSRQFRLKSTSGPLKTSPEFRNLRVHQNQRRGWQLGSGLISDELILSMLPMRPGKRADLNALAFLLSFVARWGALGARTQVGYGIIGIKEIRFGDSILSKTEIADTLTCIERMAVDHAASEGNKTGLPDIRDFFFAHVTLPSAFDENATWWSKQLIQKHEYQEAKEQGFIPSAPAVRYKMRGWFREDTSSKFKSVLESAYHLDDLRHYLMGTTYGGSNASKGSRLYVSNIYKIKEEWEFRVWGYVPDLSSFNVKRDMLMQTIKKELSSPEFSMEVFGLNQQLKLDWRCFDQNGQQPLADYLRGLVC